MRVIRFVQAGILCLAATICTDLPIYGNVGLSSPAVAKDFWTRKRVNGRWIKGHFAKHDRETSSSRHKARTEREQEAQAEAKSDVPSPVPRPLTATGSIGPVRAGDVASITFDVKTQTKIITYSDGKVDTRPFQMDGDFSEPPLIDQNTAEKLRDALLRKAEALRTGSETR